MKEKYLDLAGKIILAVAIVVAAAILAGGFDSLGDDINRGFSNLGGSVTNAANLLRSAIIEAGSSAP